MLRRHARVLSCAGFVAVLGFAGLVSSGAASAVHTPCDNEDRVYEGGDDLLVDAAGLVWVGIDKGDESLGNPDPTQSIGICVGSDVLDAGGTVSVDKGDIQINTNTNPLDPANCVAGALGICVVHDTTVTTGDDGDNTGLLHTDLYGLPDGNGPRDFLPLPDLCVVNLGTSCP